MGTPHRGSESANLAKVLGNIANLAFQAGGVLPFQRTVKTSLLEDLAQNSRELTRIADDFLQRASAFRITSFYEDRGILPLDNVVGSYGSNSRRHPLDWSVMLTIWSDSRTYVCYNRISQRASFAVMGEPSRSLSVFWTIR
jgi:hypothetical protein